MMIAKSDAEQKRANKRASRSWPEWTGFLLVVVLLSAFWFYWPTILWKWERLENPESAGQFGDMYGALTSLFSAFALFAAVFAVLLQRRDLKLQQIMLSEQLKEAKEQKEAIEEQAEAMQKLAAATARQNDLTQAEQERAGKREHFDSRPAFSIHAKYNNGVNPHDGWQANLINEGASAYYLFSRPFLDDEKLLCHDFPSSSQINVGILLFGHADRITIAYQDRRGQWWRAAFNRDLQPPEIRYPIYCKKVTEEQANIMNLKVINSESPLEN